MGSKIYGVPPHVEIKKWTQERGHWPGKKWRHFAELIQVLNDSFKRQRTKAIQVLREHYMGQGKPKIIVLYTELSILTKEQEENLTVTNYVLRAEKAEAALRIYGNVISDSLLIAICKRTTNQFYRNLKLPYVLSTKVKTYLKRIGYEN